MNDTQKVSLEEWSRLVESGDRAGAVRFSGNELAMADGRLRAHLHDSESEPRRRFMFWATMHVSALMFVSLASDALSCGLLSCCTADIYGMTSRKEYRGDMSYLMLMTSTASLQAIDTLPITGGMFEQRARFLSLLGLMLRHYTSDLSPQQLNSPMLESLPVVLAAIDCTAIPDDELTIDGKKADPSDAKTCLAELLNLAAALGILRVD